MPGDHKHMTGPAGACGVDFDAVVDRSGTASTKWQRYEGTDVLPFWVADMDFPAPPCVLGALRTRLDHGVLGYADRPPSMVDTARAWLLDHYGWAVDPGSLAWLPGVVPGMNQAVRAVGQPGDAVLVPTPVYYPFLRMPGNGDRRLVEVPLALNGDRWVMDTDALRAACTPDTRLLLLSNPQNPTGRAYTRSELEALAEFAIAQDLVVASDEIHCPLLLPGADGTRPVHTPIASLGDEIAARTISLFSPTKAYNTPALGCAFAVIPDRDLRARFKASHHGLVPSISALAWAAADAALRDRGPWLDELTTYLAGNRDLLVERVAAIDGITTTPFEATYLAWLDVRALGLADPAAFFRSHGLALNDGAPFGAPGFVRFNVGTRRALVAEGLERLAAAASQA